MKRNYYALILGFLLLVIIIPTSAQSALNIAVVDTDKAFKESIWGKKAIAELEKEVEDWQKKGEKLDSEISALEEKLAKQSAFLDDEAEEKKLQDEIQSKRMEGQALVQKGNTNLEKKKQELLGPILEETKNLIKKFAEEESYDIILEKQLIVLYLDPELDVTNQIVAMLDRAYKEKMSSKAKEPEKESEGPVIKQSEGKGAE
jgi:outer membrane protein